MERGFGGSGRVSGLRVGPESAGSLECVTNARRLDLDTHQHVFQWILEVLAKEDLVEGRTVGIDATTLEANAALRSIVRRDSDESYNEYLDGLAKASGIQTPTRKDRAKVDKKRPKKALTTIGRTRRILMLE